MVFLVQERFLAYNMNDQLWWQIVFPGVQILPATAMVPYFQGRATLQFSLLVLELYAVKTPSFSTVLVEHQARGVIAVLEHSKSIQWLRAIPLLTLQQTNFQS